MNRWRLFLSLFLSVFCIGMVFYTAQAQNQSQPAPAMPQADQFGYALEMSTITQTGWISADVPAGMVVSLNSVDDGISDPVILPFAFPYFENSYSSFRVDTNGLVHFSSAISLAANQRIPSVTIPNNFIAPFWDDLFVGVTTHFTGSVHYLTGGTAPNRYAVIEWKDVSRLTDSTSPLTFEIVLYEKGDIYFQYLEMTGDLTNATIGIENVDGLDGYLYLHNQAGLTPGQTVKFHYPASNLYGVRSLTPFESGLVVGRAASAELSFKNIGQNTSDAFEFDTGASNGWTVQISSPFGIPSLIDSDHDGLMETPPVQHDGAFTITLTAVSPMGSAQGSYVTIPVTATSVTSPSHSSVSLARFAIPANFVYAFTDLNDNTRLGYLSSAVKKEPTLNASFGRNLAVTLTPAQSYFYAWDRNYTPVSGQITNIEYAIFSAQGKVLKYITTLKDNALPGSGNMDQMPAVAAASSGKIGLLFLRRQPDGIDNIRFALLDANGQLLTNIDTQGNLTGYTSPGIQIADPRMVVTSDGNFIAAWSSIDSVTSAGNIWLAVISSADGSVINQFQLTASTDGNHYFDSPTLAKLSSARVLLSYQESELVLGNPFITTHLIALDSGGTAVPGSSLDMPGLSTAQRAIAQFVDGGPVLFTWTGGSSDLVSYLVMNDAINSAGSVHTLPQPDSLSVGSPSVLPDGSGKVIVIWQDYSLARRLYYSLINADGSLATPPVILKDSGPGETIGASTTSQSLAPFKGFYLLLAPSIWRR